MFFAVFARFEDELATSAAVVAIKSSKVSKGECVTCVVTSHPLMQAVGACMHARACSVRPPHCAAPACALTFRLFCQKFFSNARGARLAAAEAEFSAAGKFCIGLLYGATREVAGK